MKALLLFLQNEVLGMHWLNQVIGILLEQIGVNLNTRFGGSMQFFVYDVIKITVLLVSLIFVISYVQSYFPPERSRRILGRYHGLSARMMSALLGTVTPFCSCSSIPLFMIVDLGSLVLLMSIFGTKVAVAYVVIGLAIAVVGGTLIERFKMDAYVEDFVTQAGVLNLDEPTMRFSARVSYAKAQVGSTFKKVFPYILLGVGIGALIHNWIPEEWVQTVLGSNNPFGVVMATLIGIPMYADIFGTIPVAEALLAKGAQLGTVLSFMMAVTTLSLPSLIMLRKAVKPRLLGTFIAICTIGIIVVGYMFNGLEVFFV